MDTTNGNNPAATDSELLLIPTGPASSESSANATPEPAAGSEAAPAAAHAMHPAGGPSAVRTGAQIQEAPDPSDPAVVTLSDGRVARILSAKANVITKARRIMADNGENFQDCLVVVTTLINDQPITIEEFYELPLKDGLDISAAWQLKNA